MSDQTEKEVENVLKSGESGFEDVLNVEQGPLAEKVSEGDIGHSTGQGQKTQGPDNPLSDNVPEQEIGWGRSELRDEVPELPDEQAELAADTIMGMTDNVLELGGGFFVKIKKHKQFYEFEEIIEVLDEQNEKNVKRLKLDQEDKVLLRPLLMAVIKRRAKKLTPEQQLMGAVLSILAKKGRMVLEIRAENEILVDRILDIIDQVKVGNEPKKEEENTPRPEEGENVTGQGETPPGNGTAPDMETPDHQQGFTIVHEAAPDIADAVLEVADGDNGEETPPGAETAPENGPVVNAQGVTIVSQNDPTEITDVAQEIADEEKKEDNTAAKKRGRTKK